MSFWTPKSLKSTPQDIQKIWSLPAGRLGVFLDTQTLKRHPSGHPKQFVKNFLECQSQAYLWLKYEYIVVPLKILDVPIANFRHLVSKSWLRPCLTILAKSLNESVVEETSANFDEILQTKA